MNLPRYIFAGSLSLMLHAALLSAQEPNPHLHTHAGSDSPSVAVNLLSRPTPSKPAEKPAQTKAEPQPTEPTPSEQREKKPVEKKSAVKPAPVKEKVTKTEPVKAVQKPREQSLAKQVEQTEAQLEQTKVSGSEQERPPAEEALPTPVAQGVTSQPVLLEKPTFMQKPVQPKYPRVAQRKGIEGTALFEIWLDEQGQLTKLLLITSSGAKILDDAAQKAIEQWRFNPHSENGQSMPSRVRIPVRFSLE